MPPPTDSRPAPAEHATALSTYDRIARMSEPWYLNQALAIVGTLVFAIIFGEEAASGQVGMLVLLAVWVLACLVIVFVRDHWWSPALIITALSLKTFALGFGLTGLEGGLAVIGLTFPIKLAMKTLWPAKPKMEPGVLYWMLLGYVAAHAVIILFYSKIEAVPQLKNIVKAYYLTLVPLVLYGLMIRYCNPKTVYQTGVILFWLWIFTTISSIVVILLGIEFTSLTDLLITLDFTSAESAVGYLRTSGPSLLFIAIAFLPIARSNTVRVLLIFGALLGIAGVLFSTGRTAILYCFLCAGLFPVIRRRFWLTLPPIAVLALITGFCTFDPGFLYSLPEGIQRTLTPLNLSDQKTEVQGAVGDSDRWHQELLTESITYWLYDIKSFALGRGFKSWDDSLILGVNTDFETTKQFAIEMGATENMFSAITNIFGLAGLLLYGTFLIQMAWHLWKAWGLCPPGSVERAICELSFVSLVACIILAPFLGGVPGITLIYWGLGLFAARSYIASPERAPVATVLRFDISRQVPSPRQAPLLRGAPVPFARSRKTHYPFPRTGRTVQ